MANNPPTARERFFGGIMSENPTFRQILGMCPTLAVTNSVRGAVTMAAAVAFVLICSNIVTSLIRNLLKPHLRILVFTLTIAVFVIIADRVLAAYFWEMSKQLGPYVPLIIVNCIIIARCEICAAKQGVFISIADGIGQSIGHAIGLVGVATVREILGSGSWFGINLGWADESCDIYKWVIMILPPGAFLTLGLMLGTVNWISAGLARRAGASS